MNPDTSLPPTPDSFVSQVGDAITAAASTVADTSPATSVLTPLGAHPDMQVIPVNIRSLSLLLLAVFASLFVLHWAKAVFIPLMLGLIFSYALSPIVNWLEARRVPR